MELIADKSYTFEIEDKKYTGIYVNTSFDNELKILKINYINEENIYCSLYFDFSEDNLTMNLNE